MGDAPIQMVDRARHGPTHREVDDQRRREHFKRSVGLPDHYLAFGASTPELR